jgi:biopolymer transport protein ExbD
MAVTSGQNEDEVMSTINITPFTDVLLVLLIIFIILASVTKEPKLPEAKNSIKVLPSQIVVIVDAKNRVQVGSQVSFNKPEDACGPSSSSPIRKPISGRSCA